ncbi:hypothetical protein JTE90_029335 [Oedothorax gibbosus]|uniref:Uncharacterized protein n=1 Tax=Oedothorax gibbosus TaxID=931172 RepID=A0AAV6UHP9_9ARAC|nr:hypothetical protein JTE90_029335 [Oedothorax gibbosus]
MEGECLNPLGSSAPKHIVCKPRVRFPNLECGLGNRIQKPNACVQSERFMRTCGSPSTSVTIPLFDHEMHPPLRRSDSSSSAPSRSDIYGSPFHKKWINSSKFRSCPDSYPCF